MAVLDSLRQQRRRLIDLRARQVPQFQLAQGPTPHSGRIFYVAPDRQRPSGGIRVIYRHVQELNALGHQAWVMHRSPGFRCTWFEHDVPVVAGGEVSLHRDDLLVVPEWYGPALHTIPPVPRLVVFNQRAYDTFDFVDLAETSAGAPYRGLPRLAGLLTVSLDNQHFLQHTFPEVPVLLTRNVVDPQVFHPLPAQVLPARDRQIAVVPSRRPEDLARLQHILRARGVFPRWSWARIEGRSERETAEVMRHCPIFLSLSEQEGFGLPPAEAMASGCYVVGYPGLAGREFFDPADCRPVPDQDLIALAVAVEDACLRYEQAPEQLRALGRAASERILARYSRAGLHEDLHASYAALSGTRAG